MGQYISIDPNIPYACPGKTVSS